MSKPTKHWQATDILAAEVNVVRKRHLTTITPEIGASAANLITHKSRQDNKEKFLYKNWLLELIKVD